MFQRESNHPRASPSRFHIGDFSGLAPASIRSVHVGGVDNGEAYSEEPPHGSYVSRSAPHYDKLMINLLIESSRLINHDPRPTIAQMPLRGEVLIPGAEVFEVRRASVGPVPPQRRASLTRRSAFVPMR